MCSARPSEVYCTCLHTLTFLCFEDIGRHCSKLPAALHVNYPVQTLPYRQLPGYFDRLQERMASLEQGKRTLYASLETINTAIDAYEATCERLVKLINEHRNRVIEELNQCKMTAETLIKTAISHTEAGIFEDQVEENHPLSGLLRSGAPSEFTIFTYEITEDKAVEAIGRMIKYRVWSEERPAPVANAANFSVVNSAPQAVYLPRVDPDSFRFFNFQRKVWDPAVPLIRKIDCDEGSSYIALGPNRVFTCGGISGNQYTSAAYILDISGQISVLESLPSRRAFLGIILYQECVYVFGGLNRLGRWISRTHTEELED